MTRRERGKIEEGVAPDENDNEDKDEEKAVVAGAENERYLN